MERKVCFLLGSGRCGSTLAQRLLNASSEAVIWGEHDGFLKPIAESFYQSVKGTKLAELSFQEPYRFSMAEVLDKEMLVQRSIEWMNGFDAETLKAHFKAFIESIFCRSLPESITCWGFKEIRYGVGNGDRTVDLLLELFPHSKNLVVVRHPLPTITSMLTAWHPDLLDALEQALTAKDTQKEVELTDRLKQLAIDYARLWSAQNNSLLRYCQLFPENFKLIKYEEMKDCFYPMAFDFIGIAPPQEVAPILGKRLSDTGSGRRSSLTKECITSIHSRLWSVVEDCALQFNYHSL